MRHLWRFPIMMFIKDVVSPISLVTITSLVVPSLLYYHLEQSIGNAIIIMIVALISSFSFIAFLGLNKGERILIFQKSKNVINRKLLKK